MRQREPSLINALQAYRPACTKCKSLMTLASIEPSPDPDHDLRTFECDTCGTAEVIKIKYR